MHRSMRGWSQFAKSTGLSMPQFSILMQLHYSGVRRVVTSASASISSAAAASQLVDKLVQAVYQTEEDPHDRRAKLLNLTDKGKDWSNAAFRNVIAGWMNWRKVNCGRTDKNQRSANS